MKTPFVLPRSSTESAPSAVMLTAAWTRDRLGSSMTTSACGDRPIVFLSPFSRKIEGRCGRSGAGLRHARIKLLHLHMNLGAVEHRSIVIDGGPFHERWDALLHPARKCLAAVGDDGNRRGEIEYVGRSEQRERRHAACGRRDRVAFRSEEH